MIRQRERHKISHWQDTLAVPAIAAVSLVLCATTAIGAEKNYTAAFEDAFNMTMPPAWSQNYPATQIIGNLYDVGGYDLSSFLITSDAGHILINTGLEGSAAMIESNLKSLGLRMADIKILLTTQAHFDHTADLALIKEQTGARLLATEADKSFLEDGGLSDPLIGGIESFRPVTVDDVITDGDLIELGDIRLSVLEHPGHTEGSASYAMTITDSGNSYDVLVVNMAYINEGVNVAIKPTYHGIAADFEKTFESQRKLSPDVWVSSHKSAYGFHEKHTPGQSYDPRAFYDPAGYIEAIRLHEVTFVKKVYDELLGKIADNSEVYEENVTK
ncbi:MAG: subclass B3 metallo-beta-lactamase [Pseudomonadota bacterium]|nr:subclass B3 metallo-beta-lactamase [Pseudomonadota bacterium]